MLFDQPQTPRCRARLAADQEHIGRRAMRIGVVRVDERSPRRHRLGGEMRNQHLALLPSCQDGLPVDELLWRVGAPT